MCPKRATSRPRSSSLIAQGVFENFFARRECSAITWGVTMSQSLDARSTGPIFESFLVQARDREQHFAVADSVEQLIVRVTIQKRLSSNTRSCCASSRKAWADRSMRTANSGW